MSQLSTEHCPICGSDCDASASHNESRTLEEYNYECAKCGYSYEFAYGAVSEHVGGLTFVHIVSGHYTLEEQRVQEFVRALRDTALAFYRLHVPKAH